jgi:acylphosphatase
MRRLRITVVGSVQGVFYRAFAKSEAEKLKITGWVKNLPDGNVEILAEGPENEMKTYIDILRNGPQGAVIEKLILEDQPYKKEFTTFKITY